MSTPTPVPPAPTRADPRLALARWYNEQMLAWNRAYLQGGEGVATALRSFDRVSDHVRALQPWLAARVADDDAAAELCNDLPKCGGFMAALRLDRHEQIRWTEAALAGARRLGLWEMEGAHLGNLGNSYLYLGDAVRAGELFRAALDVLGTEGHPLLRASVLGNLGLTYANQGRVTEAIDIFQEHLSISRAADDKRSMALPLGNLGIAYTKLGQPRVAIGYLDEALQINVDLGDLLAQAYALNSLGNAWTLLGELDRAIDCFQRSLALKRRLGAAHGIANSLLNLGIAYMDRGDAASAAEMLEEGLRVIDGQAAADGALGGDLRARGKTVGSLGQARAMLGELDEAHRLFREELRIAETVQDRMAAGSAHRNLGALHAQRGELETARGHFEAALDAARSTGDRHTEAASGFGVAGVFAARGDFAAAIATGREALAIFEGMESPDAAPVRAALEEWEHAGSSP